MIQQELIVKNSMVVQMENGSVAIVNKDFFESTYYQNNDVVILGTVNLANPIPKGSICRKGVYVNHVGYELKSTFSANVFGYYQIEENQFVRVENIKPKKKKDFNPCLFKFPKVLKEKERSSVVFLERDNLLCEPHTFGFANKTPVIKKEAIEGLKRLQKEKYKLIVLVNENDVEKGACSYNFIVKYNRILAIKLLLSGVKLDAIYITGPDNQTPEILISKASDECFLAVKGSSFMGATNDWIKFTKGSNLLPQFIISAKAKNSEHYIAFPSLSDAVESFLTKSYLKKRRKRTVREKPVQEKSVQQIVIEQQIKEKLEEDDRIAKERYASLSVTKKVEEAAKPSPKQEPVSQNKAVEIIPPANGPRTMDEILSESKDKYLHEKEEKKQQARATKPEKEKRVVVDNFDFPTKPEKNIVHPAIEIQRPQEVKPIIETKQSEKAENFMLPF